MNINELYSRVGKSSLFQYKILQEPAKFPRKQWAPLTKSTVLEAFETLKIPQLNKPRVSAVFRIPEKKPLKASQSPAVGTYHVSHALVEKKVTSLHFRKDKPRTRHPAPENRVFSENPRQKRIPGVPFSKQLNRKEWKNISQETQFPLQGSEYKFRQWSTPNFKQYISRPSPVKGGHIEPVYYPNKELIFPKLSYSLKFSRMGKRFSYAEQKPTVKHREKVLYFSGEIDLDRPFSLSDFNPY